MREAPDAAARSPELAEMLAAHLAAPSAAHPAGSPVTVADLGCGTGAVGRWLAGRLPGPQLWTLHDRDPQLLARAAVGLPAAAADGAPVTTRTREGDLTSLRAEDLAGTTLVTASALLDLLTAGEVHTLAEACAGAGCAALLTLSVTGHVEITPPDPRDRAFAAAFDAHQRRTVDGRPLLGPDAGPTTVEAFTARGARVETRSSPWRIGPDRAALAEEWLHGWVGAACAQEPELAAGTDDYLRDRLYAAAAGRLDILIDHVDVLALPGRGRP